MGRQLMDYLVNTLSQQEPELRRLIQLFDNGHDEFQIKHFIVDANGVTPYGKFKQCVLEIQTRYFNIKRGLLELKEFRLTQQQLRACPPPDETQAALNHIKIRQLNIDIEQREVALRTQLRELNTFVRVAKQLESEIDWDSEVELIEDFWRQRLTHQMTNALLWPNNQVQAVMNFVAHMPEPTRRAFIQNAVKALDAIDDLSSGQPQKANELMGGTNG